METETETETKLIGNPKKLPDDSWGAWVDGQPQVGDVITIQTRGGKQWDAEIVEIIEQAGVHTSRLTQRNRRPEIACEARSHIDLNLSMPVFHLREAKRCI